MLTAQELFIPQVTKKPRTNKVPWWSKQVKAAEIKSKKYFRGIKLQHHKQTMHPISLIEIKLKILLCCARLNYESQLIANMKTKPRCFNSYLRSQKKLKDHIEYLTKPDGTQVYYLYFP